MGEEAEGVAVGGRFRFQGLKVDWEAQWELAGPVWLDGAATGDTIPLSPNTFLAPRRDSQLCREQAAWERPAPEAGSGDGPHPRSAGHRHAALGGT